MPIREAALAVVRNSISRVAFPGQYMLADSAARLLQPRSGFMSSRIGGYAVDLDLRDDVQRHVYFNLYDRPLTRLLGNLLSHGSVFYDIGANIGYFTLLGSALVGPAGEVHAFEPVPENMNRIENAIKANDITNIIVNRIAVSDRRDTLTLFLPELVTNSGWASVVPSARRQRELEVPTLPLDEYVSGSTGKRRPDLIKIDVEGAEPNVLAGMQNILRSEAAPDLVIEINPFLLTRADSSPQTVIDVLVSAGYKLFQLTDKGPRQLPTNATFEHLADVYATKRHDRSRLDA